MTSRNPRHFFRAFTLIGLAFVLASCDDDNPTDNTPTTTTSSPPSGNASAFLRAAPLTFDAGNVDVVIGNQTISALSYPDVSGYIELDPGTYRVQFFPSGSRTSVISEASVTLSDDESVTAALVGLTAPQVTVFEDDRSTDGNEAGLALVNTVPDFPASFDLRVANGDTLFRDVSYLEMTDVNEVSSGTYDIELLRGGTNEVVATASNSDFGNGTSYTIYAVGSLRHGDIQLVVASESP